jgi:regulator of protease activity HflC (stomatin/prohibitin superfamily)
MLFLLGEKYIQALDKISASGNSKVVLLPADLQDAVRGLLGRARSA